MRRHPAIHSVRRVDNLEDRGPADNRIRTQRYRLRQWRAGAPPGWRGRAEFSRGQVARNRLLTRLRGGTRGVRPALETNGSLKPR